MPTTTFADKFYKMLLESTLAIPWKINWETKEFDYIGPQIEKVLGWSPASWKSAQDWIDRMHPDDIEDTVNYCVKLSDEGVDHEADYRALTKSGDYIWMRDVVHVIRKNNKTVAIIGFMFDISERKQMELELVELNKLNQSLLREDSLTEISNRTAFDERISMEFSRSQRNYSPLSLLFFDIDHFKRYNDKHGHQQGDICLKVVAQTLAGAFNRPADFVCRLGGEEFVALLPDTDNTTALLLAETSRSAVENQNIPHGDSETSDFVTCSVGVTTMSTSHIYRSISAMIEDADKNMYLAKKQGRNQVNPNPKVYQFNDEKSKTNKQQSITRQQR
ncbi:sensor domain-containing diguanylate cyclase [Vibrio agarivorans]|uniref:sensor domain-containing diguanylate cyclase n=1 Tax=Vibrio agarivorans TaxID=153622 RepID=UPI002232AD0D|nr:sensor domain-containing diguanylate cyclase [Vibrio agarivorans]